MCKGFWKATVKMIVTEIQICEGNHISKRIRNRTIFIKKVFINKATTKFEQLTVY